MIKAVILDFYGVIQTDNLLIWAEKRYQQFPDLKQVIDDTCRKLDLDQITLEEYYQAFADAVNEPIEQVKADMADEIAINYPLLDVAIKLREQGIKTAILSNDGSSLRAYIEEIGVTGYFDEVFVSGELNMMKPDTRIYEYVIQKLGIEPQQAIFFDDRQTNVDGALRAGLQSELYTSVSQVRKLLS